MDLEGALVDAIGSRYRCHEWEGVAASVKKAGERAVALRVVDQLQKQALGPAAPSTDTSTATLDAGAQPGKSDPAAWAVWRRYVDEVDFSVEAAMAEIGTLLGERYARKDWEGVFAALQDAGGNVHEMHAVLDELEVDADADADAEADADANTKPARFQVPRSLSPMSDAAPATTVPSTPTGNSAANTPNAVLSATSGPVEDEGGEEQVGGPGTTTSATVLTGDPAMPAGLIIAQAALAAPVNHPPVVPIVAATVTRETQVAAPDATIEEPTGDAEEVQAATVAVQANAVENAAVEAQAHAVVGVVAGGNADGAPAAEPLGGPNAASTDAANEGLEKAVVGDQALQPPADVGPAAEEPAMQEPASAGLDGAGDVAEIDWQNATLDDVLDYLRSLQGNNIERGYIIEAVTGFRVISNADDWTIALRRWAQLEDQMGFPTSSVSYFCFLFNTIILTPRSRTLSTSSVPQGGPSKSLSGSNATVSSTSHTLWRAIWTRTARTCGAGILR